MLGACSHAAHSGAVAFMGVTDLSGFGRALDPFYDI